MRLLLCLIFMLISSLASAQTDSAHTLKNIEVIAHLYKDSSVNAVQVLDKKILQQMTHLSTADALRYFTGVQIKDYGGLGGLKTINIRSMGSAHTTIFYNGLPISNAQNSQVDLGRFSVDNLEKVEVYTSHNGAIFQPAKAFSSAASVYFTTLTPTMQPQQPLQVKTQLKLGSFGLIAPSVAIHHQITPRWIQHINTSLTHSAGNYPFRYKGNGFDTVALRQNSDLKNIRLEYGLQHHSHHNEWKVNIYAYHRNMGLPRVIVSNNFESREREVDYTFFVQSNYKKNISEKYNLQLLQKYSFDKLIYTNPAIQKTYIHQQDTSFGPLQNTYIQQEYYNALVQQYQIRPWWRIALSNDWVYNDIKADLDRFSFPSRHNLYNALSTHTQWKNIQAQATLLQSSIYEQARNQPAYWQHHTLPMLSISYVSNCLQNTTLKASYKESYRLPSFSEMYYTAFGVAHLKPEWAKQWNVGYTSDITTKKIVQSIQVQHNFYLSKVQDKIIGIPVNLFHYQMMNIGKVQIKGMDIALALTVKIQKVTAYHKINYTLEQAIDISDDFSYNHGQYIPYAPKHSFSYIGNINYKQWSLNYSFIYTGARYSQAYNTRDTYVLPWYTSDIALRKKITFNSSISGIFFAECNNVFNQNYDVVINYPMPGRNFRAGIHIHFFKTK